MRPRIPASAALKRRTTIRPSLRDEPHGPAGITHPQSPSEASRDGDAADGVSATSSDVLGSRPPPGQASTLQPGRRWSILKRFTESVQSMRIEKESPRRIYA